MSTLPVITISRTYGAGGRSVAKLVSERLGIPWYDQDFVKETALYSGYSVEDIQREGEQLSAMDKFFDFMMNGIVVYNSIHDKIFQAEKEEILRLAKNPCLIVGRCSNIILREAGIPSFDVFLYANIDFRLERAEKLKENGKQDLRHFVERTDALREKYYRNYTKHELGDYNDYTVSLDTGVLGYEKTADVIVQLLKDYRTPVL